MATIVKYDQTTGKVIGVSYSAHTPDFEGRDDVLINPEFEKPASNYKVVSGKMVKKTEQDLIDEKALERKNERKDHLRTLLEDAEGDLKVALEAELVKLEG